ncbi:nucleotidyltransferase family protein [Oceanospirillum sanctuarii]|uniref:nucleotidyltransferase family protein n=1 Tax=Oceanospirillum sanctuarii TaxID=1434821 RepID=UPI000A3B4488|nr:nucleotidyltransferase family protein [Oceanospirillum sanctuarii]
MTRSFNSVKVLPEDTIRDALQIINNEALRIALVVNSDDELLGVITDGDVRRGLLKGKGLEDSAETVMNRSPITADIGTSRQALTQKMNKLDLLAIPIVDGNKLVGLETLHSALTEKSIKENPVFLMAGGFGTRLRPLTDTCPKPMLKIGDKPILEILIRRFIEAGFCNFYISTHYMPELISDHFGDGTSLGVNITYIHEESPLGTGGALGLLPDDLPQDLPLIMMNGDVLTKVDFERLLDFHNEHNADATMCVREYDYQIPYGVVNGDGGKITSMVEKPIQRFFVNAGIYVLSSHVVNSVAHNQKIDMPTLLEQYRVARDNILMFPIHEYWLDIGRMDDFKRAQNDIYGLGLD